MTKRLLQTRLLLLPGIGDSPADHWQSAWQQLLPGSQRFQPDDWNAPHLQDWLQALEQAIEAMAEPLLLVAHSLSCLLVAHWALHSGSGESHTHHLARVRGAFLVAPPDPASAVFPAAARGFAELPEGPLPFPALVLASCDDPYASLAHARRQASQWQAEFAEAGALGHISSGLGDWPQGLALLEDFCQRRGIP
ncbi:RBBP9/YdeN family alpha/beta hydrolase [Pseudomonas sp. NCHU5208]|uniref:RBBP9/YdeN family alpha/beta hydrolase n=1 Tax=unclassified Pseudomonas TaxID=196821 RepID=UPI003F9E765E